MSYQQSSAASGYPQPATTGQYPPGYTKETYEAYCRAYYAQQQALATSTSTSTPKSKTPKDKKPSSSRKEEATLLKVERQWAAYYEQQRAAEASDSALRDPEPEFTAFTLAGGRSYLEDGSPSPLSSDGRGGKPAGY